MMAATATSCLAHVITVAVLIVLTFTVSALACSVPFGSCSAAKCDALGKVPGRYDPKMGFYQGIWNNVSYPNKKDWEGKRGGPYVNYEVFVNIGNIIPQGYSTATTLKDCCHACRVTDGCKYYHFFPTATKPKTATMTGWNSAIKCYLIDGGNATDPGANGGTVPWSSTHSYQVGQSKNYDASWLGGTCNGNPGVVDDPHFVGAQGTKFDFNGEAGQSVCLVTDDRLHVNALLGGYEGVPVATGFDNSQKTLRTWIQEVGITWKADDGSAHTIQMVARKGKDQARGAAGFLSQLIIDGQSVAPPQEAGASTEGSGVALTLKDSSKKGPYDVDTYTLVIPGVAEMTVRMRVAHPLLQTPEEAYAHFNLHFNDLKVTPNVHGVLGQTFRQTLTQAQRATEFGLLSRLLSGPIVADGPSGAGFLDGKPSDYKTSSVLATDCSFSAFKA